MCKIIINNLKQNKMEFKKILVTPTLAKQYLEANTQNRRVKKPVVDRYANDILNGRWKADTAEFIKISKNGIVLDGQHRLCAVVKSDTPTFFHIAFDVDDSVFSVLDTGSNRNASDCFKIKGIKNDTILPSMIAFYYAFSNNVSTKGGDKDKKMTNEQLVLEYYKDEEKWQKIAKKAMAWYNSFAKILPPSFIGGFYARTFELYGEKADDFMDMLCSGNNISNNSISLLRQKLIKDKISLKKISQPIKLAFTVKTWNNFINEIHGTKVLKYSPDKEGIPRLSKIK